MTSAARLSDCMAHSSLLRATIALSAPPADAGQVVDLRREPGRSLGRISVSLGAKGGKLGKAGEEPGPSPLRGGQPEFSHASPTVGRPRPNS